MGSDGAMTGVDAAGVGAGGAGGVVLEARGLALSWDEGASTCVQVDALEVREGELVCLVGRSGCGKTTLLHALAGLTRPLSGQVLLRGRDVTGLAGQVSYMFQKDLLLPNKRVVDNVCLPLTLAGVPKAEARERAQALLGRFGLAGCEGKWPGELSGGMRQRAAFLRTYLMGNDVVLLDEPFSALDALTRADLRDWYLGAARELGLSTLMITHDVDEAVSMASRIYVLSAGEGPGEPARISDEVEVGRAAGADAGDFGLTPEFLTAKREVLLALGVG